MIDAPLRDTLRSRLKIIAFMLEDIPTGTPAEVLRKRMKSIDSFLQNMPPDRVATALQYRTQIINRKLLEMSGALIVDLYNAQKMIKEMLQSIEASKDDEVPS